MLSSLLAYMVSFNAIPSDFTVDSLDGTIAIERPFYISPSDPSLAGDMKVFDRFPLHNFFLNLMQFSDVFAVPSKGGELIMDKRVTLSFAAFCNAICTMFKPTDSSKPSSLQKSVQFYLRARACARTSHLYFMNFIHCEAASAETSTTPPNSPPSPLRKEHGDFDFALRPEELKTDRFNGQLKLHVEALQNLKSGGGNVMTILFRLLEFPRSNSDEVPFLFYSSSSLCSPKKENRSTPFCMVSMSVCVLLKPSRRKIILSLRSTRKVLPKRKKKRAG